MISAWTHAVYVFEWNRKTKERRSIRKIFAFNAQPTMKHWRDMHT